MAKIEVLYKPSDIAFGKDQEQKDRGWTGLMKAVLIQHRERVYTDDYFYNTEEAAHDVITGNKNAIPAVFAECVARDDTSVAEIKDALGLDDKDNWSNILTQYASYMICRYLWSKHPEIEAVDDARYKAVGNYGNLVLQEGLADAVESQYGLPPLVKK